MTLIEGLFPSPLEVNRFISIVLGAMVLLILGVFPSPLEVNRFISNS